MTIGDRHREHRGDRRAVLDRGAPVRPGPDPARRPHDRRPGQGRDGRGRGEGHRSLHPHLAGDAPGLAPHHRAVWFQHDQGLHGAFRAGGRSRRRTTSSSSTSVPSSGTAEGDAGDTFVFGDDPDHHRAKHDVRAIWEDVRRVWFDEADHRTGAVRLRREGDRGTRVEAEPGPLGPPTLRLPALRALRRCPWPTSPSARIRISGCSRSPSPTPIGGFGAFYEDLLLEDQSFPDGSVRRLESSVSSPGRPPIPEGASRHIHRADLHRRRLLSSVLSATSPSRLVLRRPLTGPTSIARRSSHRNAAEVRLGNTNDMRA